MASPMMFYVVPNCGLKITLPKNAKHAHLYEPDKPFKYNLNDTNDFVFNNPEDSKRLFGGVMSPSFKVTLPKKIRVDCGIPQRAERFAYMHPPKDLAPLIDWKAQRHHQVTVRDDFEDHPVRKSRAGFSDKDIEGRQIGIRHAMLLGAFVYFGNDMEILSINALCFEPTGFDIKFSGPWQMTDDAVCGMQELDRLQTIPIDILLEGGFVSSGWVNPSEMFASQLISADQKNPNGSMVFLREDGTGVAYHIADASGIYFPRGDVEILVDCVESLGAALKTGDLSFTNKHVKVATDLKNKDAGAIDEFGWAPLHYACRFSSFSAEDIYLIERLVDRSPDMVKKPDRFGRLPLHLAADGNAPLKVIKLLIDKYKDAVVGKTKVMGMIPLHIACNRGAKAEIIRAMLDADTSEESVKTASVLGRLPLHMAIEERMDSEVVDLLLEKGNINDIYAPFCGLLPIHLACLNNSNPRTVALLLNKDANNTTKDAKVQSQSSDASKKMAFVALTSHGIQGMIPLHLALTNAGSDVIRLLLMKEKKKNKLNLDSNTVYIRDSDNKCALHLACQNDVRLDIIRLLLDLDPENRALHYEDKREMKPIHYACNKPKADPEVIELVLKAEKEGQGKAMHRNLLQKMVKKGKGKVYVLTHSMDDRKRSPLLCAIKTGAGDEVIEILTRPENFYLKGFDDHSVRVLGTKVNNSRKMQDHVIEILATRSHFTILSIELYANVFAISAFIAGSERLLDGTLTYFEPAVLAVCIALFIIRELAQIKSQGFQYVKDVWSWNELAATGFLIASVMHMIDFVERDVVARNGDTFEIKRQLMIITGILLIVQFIFFCRATFLPFGELMTANAYLSFSFVQKKC